jgi:hypothetical protein
MSALRYWSATVLVAGVVSVSAAPTAKAEPSAQAFVAKAHEALADREVGQAILNFERARLISPGSDVIAEDLAHVRAAAGLPVNEPRAAGTSAQLLRSDQWGEMALMGLAVALGAMIAFFRRMVGRSAFLVIAVLASTVTVVALVGAIRAAPASNLAVVVSEEPVARVGPSLGAPASFTLREGSMVFIQAGRGDFVLVSDGARRGWILRHGVEAVLPES